MINVLHPEKAEVGKKYWFSGSLIRLKEYVENNVSSYVGELKTINPHRYCPFRMTDGSGGDLLYPYEEPPKQRMTNRQLAEWLAKGNGVYRFVDVRFAYHYFAYEIDTASKEVSVAVLIRHWGSEEWVEPTVDIYERDCKGGKELPKYTKENE